MPSRLVITEAVISGKHYVRSYTSMSKGQTYDIPFWNPPKAGMIYHILSIFYCKKKIPGKHHSLFSSFSIAFFSVSFKDF